MRLLITTILLSLSFPSIAQENTDLIFRGTASVGGFHFFQNQNSSSNLLQPLGASLSVNARVGYHKFIVPVSVSLNNQGVNFQNPFNRYGISPTYKWAKVHLGWRSMRFSKFSMQNTQFFGAGLELTPGIFRFSAMKGRIEYRIPSLPSEFQKDLPKRNALAFKIGLGNRKRNVDLSFVKVKDDAILDNSGLAAKENVVIGLSTHVPLWNDHIIFDVDGAVSALTENNNAADNFLSNVKFPKPVSAILNPNNSTHVNYAVEGGVTFRFGAFGLKNTYRRIMPEYQSLGLNYLRNDQEAIVSSPSISLWKGKVSLSSSIGFERNNIDYQRNQSQQRIISSANISIRPGTSHNLNIQYANFSFDQRIAFDSLVTDTIVVQQINRNIGATYSYTLTDLKKIRLISISANIQDAQNLSQSMLGNTTNSIIANYSQTEIESKFTYNIGLTYFDLIFSENTTSQVTVSSGVAYRNDSHQLRFQLGGLTSVRGTETRTAFTQFSWRKTLSGNLSLQLSNRIRYLDRKNIRGGFSTRSDVRILWKW